MNLFRFKSALLFVTLLAVAGCNREDDLPDEPVINKVEYLEFEKSLVINFTDGDGNFGLSADLIDPPFQAWDDSLNGIINKNHNNLWLDVFVKESGTFEMLETANLYGFDFRIPFLTPQGQNKQLKVKATYNLIDLDDFVSAGVLELGDTLKFVVTIVDRDLNTSNTVVSEGHILRD